MHFKASKRARKLTAIAGDPSGYRTCKHGSGSSRSGIRADADLPTANSIVPLTEGRAALRTQGEIKLSANEWTSAPSEDLGRQLSLVESSKVRFGRAVLFNVRPRRDRQYDELGHCNVCGQDTRFVFNSWVIPDDQFEGTEDPNVPLAYRRRESLFCSVCTCSQRVRGFADVLISLFNPGCDSLSTILAEDRFRSLDVAEINSIGSLGSLHAFLRQLPNLSYSEYRGSDRLGEMIDGARNEDICNLTYADHSFDLVLSSDTLEHVPDFRAALRETWRILRPGGRHLFTVPVVAKRRETTPRISIGSDGSLTHLMTPLYHGRGGGLFRYVPVGTDLLTFTEFGLDLTDHIRDAGFEAEVFNGDGRDGTGATFIFSGRVPDEN